jgi:hypothetical protein
VLGRTERARTPITMWALAVWTYQRQKAHLDGGRIGGIGYGAVSQTAAALERVRLGGTSAKRHGVSRTYADDDALTVHEMVLRMTADEQALVIGTAEAARAPDWSPRIPALRVVPLKGRKNKPKGIYDRHGHLIGHEIGYAGFLPERAAAVIAFARESHMRWYEALHILQEALAATKELKRWLITGIGVERKPWLQ